MFRAVAKQMIDEEDVPASGKTLAYSFSFILYFVVVAAAAAAILSLYILSRNKYILGGGGGGRIVDKVLAVGVPLMATRGQQREG